MAKATQVQVRRVYDLPESDDGQRVLVDRLWPRGVSRDRIHVDAWAKDLAPSAALRTWFGHDPDRFDAFRRRYVEELRRHREAIAELRRRAREGRVTLVYGAKDAEHNDAVVLAEVIRRGLPAEGNASDRRPRR